MGSLTVNNTFKKTNYYAYGDALFITESYITDFLKTALTEDMWTTTSTDLASWLSRWCNLMKAACFIYIVGSLQVSACLQKSRNGHGNLSRAWKQSLVTVGFFRLPSLDHRWLWPLLTNPTRTMGHEPCPHHFQRAHVARFAWRHLQYRL